LVALRSVHTTTADHHKRVDIRGVRARHASAGAHWHAAACRDDVRGRGHDLASVGIGQPGCALKYLVRSDQVERLKTLEDHEDNASSFHAFTLQQPQR
jgi:hypothetical protein